MRNGIVLITTLLVFGPCFAADAGYFVGKSRDGIRYWIDLDSHYSELCDDGKSRPRLFGQFLWIFNKDPALQINRPMPQLG